MASFAVMTIIVFFPEAADVLHDGDAFPVGLDGQYPVAPAEIVDLNACGENGDHTGNATTSLPSFTWPGSTPSYYNAEASAGSSQHAYGQNWVSPATTAYLLISRE